MFQTTTMKEPWILSRMSLYRFPGLYSDMLDRLHENEAAFDRYKIRPRVLVNVDQVDTSTEVFGTKVLLTRCIPMYI